MMKAVEEGLKSNRKPLCGGDIVSDQLREKIEKIAQKNRMRSMTNRSGAPVSSNGNRMLSLP